MIGRIFTVGGLTLLSRLTGFARDILLAAVLGAGPVADAFFVAFRLPNHFRAIFAEGAFNAAFVPAYARIRAHRRPGLGQAVRRSHLHAPARQPVFVVGRRAGVHARRDLGAGAGICARIRSVHAGGRAHPHHLSVSAADDAGDALRRHSQCAAALRRRRRGADPAQSGDDGDAGLAASFASAGHAAAWGVLLSGILQALLVGGDTLRNGVMAVFRRPHWDEDVKSFFKALGPAIIGSAGLQIALFADTIIASFLSAGALSALYYADRLNQLPIGVIGIAAGTVVLPEMARRIAAATRPAPGMPRTGPSSSRSCSRSRASSPFCSFPT